MRVRALNSDGDFTFGAGTSNYLQANKAIAQNIQTRLASVLGNCFFDLNAGIDWFNLLATPGQANFLILKLNISTTILKTTGVTGINQLSLVLEGRSFIVTYQVQTVYSVVNSSFTYSTSVG